MWTRVNCYDVMVDFDQFRIFPKDPRTGRVRPVTITRNFLHLRHTVSGVLTTFKRHRHQRRWLWQDSRLRDGRGGPCDERDVLAEVSRMVGCPDRAVRLLTAAVTGQNVV